MFLLCAEKAKWYESRRESIRDAEGKKKEERATEGRRRSNHNVRQYQLKIPMRRHSTPVQEWLLKIGSGESWRDRGTETPRYHYWDCDMVHLLQRVSGGNSNSHRHKEHQNQHLWSLAVHTGGWDHVLKTVYLIQDINVPSCARMMKGQSSLYG